jgi:hypothetical protein
MHGKARRQGGMLRRQIKAMRLGKERELMGLGKARRLRKVGQFKAL